MTRKHNRLLRIVGVLTVPAAFVIASPAEAAEEGATAKLVSAIAAGCKDNLIAPAALRTALSKSYTIDFWSAPDRNGVIAQIQQAAISPGPLSDDPNADSYSRIGLTVRGWLTDDPLWLSLSKGGVKIERANGAAPGDQDLGPVLQLIFATDGPNPAGYRFVCKSPGPGPRGSTEVAVDKTPKPTLTIAKEAGQLGKLNADDQKAGEISFTDDRIKKNLTFATTIAVGLRIPISKPTSDKPSSQGTSITRANLIPFVSYDRQGGSDPSDDSYVNNLAFGLQTNGYLHINSGAGRNLFQAYYALNARYETDDGLRSSAWIGEIEFEPLFGLPGNATPYFLNEGQTAFGFSWSTMGVFDHASVTDPWKKKALVDLKQYTRLGGDLTGALILRRWKGRYDMSGDYVWSVALSSTFSKRWDLGSRDGDARLWSSKLSFSPSKNYSFSLGYDQGRNLESLALKKQWKVTIDLKK